MSFKEKNIAVTLVNFMLIMAIFLVSIFQMHQTDTFTPENVFRLFGVVVFLAVIVTVVAIILTHVVPGVLRRRRTGDDDEPIMDDFEDERDKSIDMRGTQVTYTVSSFGSFIAMMTFVTGQPALVMFCWLIFFGVLAQIVGDITRLMLYREGF